ncbi:acetolactate synthase, large subunit, biosynthetic type [Campylobacterota bacterium]|nr:acetolactate synthase, large subunit, biosynthetic type [Campylobacterota bacterium]
MIVADYIVDFLIKRGVKRAYGYPGSLAGFVMDALRKRSGEIENHLLYTEQACGFAAIGDALVSGVPTLCWATSGPGAANLVTPIADAFHDSAPVIFLTANVHTADSRERHGLTALRQNGNQELDITTIVRSITKFAARAESAEELPQLLEQAWHAAVSGRKAPVLIDLPIDISRTLIAPRDQFSDQLIEPSESFTPRDFALIAEMIAGAKQPIIIAGAGITSAGVADEFRKWLERAVAANPALRAVITLPAKDLLPCDHPLLLGVLGVWGHEAANEMVKTADTIISFGSRLANRQLAPFGGTLPAGARLYRVDIDDAEFARSVTSFPAQTELIAADLRSFFRSAPQSLPCRVVVSDVGQNMWRVSRDLRVREGDRVIFSAGLGAMGFSLPAAIGAGYAAQGAKIYAITGDGGLQMSLEELHFLAQHRLAITIVLLNNRSLGLIRAFQARNFDGEFFATTDGSGYAAPDFQALAKAFGIGYTLFNELHRETGGGGNTHSRQSSRIGTCVCRRSPVRTAAPYRSVGRTYLPVKSQAA